MLFGKSQKQDNLTRYLKARRCLEQPSIGSEKRERGGPTRITLTGMKEAILFVSRAGDARGLWFSLATLN
jgi:hypothetical protein